MSGARTSGKSAQPASAVPARPAALTRIPVLDTQRALTNGALVKLFESTGLGRHYEREAEGIAASAGPARVTPLAGVDPLPRHTPSNGTALPRSLRAPMERRFGADLGAVRIHADSAARSLTDELDARAVTIGGDIFFSNPSESGDRVLLAHELAHVLQQRAGAAARVQRAPKGGTQKAAEATPEDKRQFLQDSVKFLREMGDFYRDKARMAVLSKTKLKIDPPKLLRSWKKAIDTDLNIINTTLGGDPALLKDLKAAYQDMVQGVMAAAAEAETVQLHEAFQKYKEHIHELGWPEASIETDANKLSDAIPAAERSRIQLISNVKVDVPGKFNLDELFKKKAGTTFLPPSGTEVVLSGKIPDDLKKGITSIGAGLITELKPPVLKLNSTISLAIDLSKFGGDYALYRFTYYTHTEKGKKKDQLLIERLGVVGMEGLRATAQEAAKKKFNDHKFTFAGTWDPGDQEHVLSSVNLIPDSILSLVDGVKFARGRVAPKPDEAGNYSMEKHTITLFNLAFDKSSVRFGMPGPSLTSPAAFATAHEIGHAIDRAKLRAAVQKENTAKAALKSGFKQYEVAPDQYVLEKVPLSVLREFNALMAQTKASTKVVTESGMRFLPKAGSDKDELQDDPKANTKFQQAAKAAGSIRVSPYAEESWEEYFAESFALYVTDPATLKRLRPKIFEHFEKTFTETKKKKK